MTEFKPIKEGKVREIYDNGDSLIMVATDRISAFDVILKNKVTNKGKVLTQMSRFWFDYTKDVLPNHMLSVDTADMPEFFRTPAFEGRSMKCRKLTMLPIECIVRGYITGSKFEFGLDENGNVVLGDEMLTPDSSRFWPLEGYEAGHGQPSFDKQFVRNWLKANPDSNYDLPQDVIDKTIAKYEEAYELLTGKKL